MVLLVEEDYMKVTIEILSTSDLLSLSLNNYQRENDADYRKPHIQTLL